MPRTTVATVTNYQFRSSIIIIIFACMQTASLHNGISGNIILNDAGDRINANYDIWSVTKSKLDTDQYIWRHDIN
jgi:hypothetical protein